MSEQGVTKKVEKGKWASVPQVPACATLSKVVELATDFILVVIKLREYNPEGVSEVTRKLSDFKRNLPENAYLMITDSGMDVEVSRPKEVCLTIEDSTFSLTEEGIDNLVKKIEHSKGDKFNITLKGCTFLPKESKEEIDEPERIE
jgi:hypothetical protein